MTCYKNAEINKLIYRKFLLFKRDKHNKLEFVKIIDEGDFSSLKDWKTYLNTIAIDMGLNKSDYLIFQFDDSKPCLELSYVHSIKSVKNTEYFEKVFDLINTKNTKS